MHKKIDIYYNKKYMCSTNQSKTCKQAKERYLAVLKRMVEHNSAGCSANYIASMKTILENDHLVKCHFDKK
jgi:hypothetical protein